MSKIERIRTGVKAFIMHQGKILVVKERVTRGDEVVVIHDVPGGGIELGETLHEALKREVFEEVGLQIKIDNPVGGWDFVIELPESSVHIVCLGYQCQLVGDDTITTSKNPAKEDIFETMWMSPEELIASEEILVNPDMRTAVSLLRL